jgi:di/tricarboxylate transporter
VALLAASYFLSLFDHVEHTLVMGLEGYHFAYYWKLGLPLIVIGVGVPLSFLFWPPGRTGGIIRPLLR